MIVRQIATMMMHRVTGHKKSIDTIEWARNIHIWQELVLQGIYR
jgi:hypothetical protein